MCVCVCVCCIVTGVKLAHRGHVSWWGNQVKLRTIPNQLIKAGGTPPVNLTLHPARPRCANSYSSCLSLVMQLLARVISPYLRPRLPALHNANVYKECVHTCTHTYVHRYSGAGTYIHICAYICCCNVCMYVGIVRVYVNNFQLFMS